MNHFNQSEAQFFMSIKSDKWIRRMAEQQGMIEPFVSGQVKHSEYGKVISYGTSSYGYDVRCSDEFKILIQTVL
jgi:dCTP deaminase